MTTMTIERAGAPLRDDAGGWYCGTCLMDLPDSKPCGVCAPPAVVPQRPRLAPAAPTARPAASARAISPAPGGVLARRESGTPAVVQPSAVTQGPPTGGPEPVDGALLWYLVRRYLRYYVEFRSEAQATLVTAWVFHACARDRGDTGMGQLIWRASPRLLVTSRDRGAGKSTLLDLITILTGSKRGKIPKITAAKIARVLGKHCETVALDEAKTIFGSGAKSLELQGILLAGYTPRASYEVAKESLPLFGAVAYAAKDELITETRGSQIGDLLDRSLKVALRAAFKPEVDEQAEDDGELLARALVAWTNGNRAGLKQSARDIAAEDYAEAERAGVANPRAVQISRPLRACGRVVGAGAEEDVRAAVAELTGGHAGAESADLMAGLRKMRGAGEGEDLGEDEPGQIVMSGEED